jgi:hypothetical protein
MPGRRSSIAPLSRRSLTEWRLSLGLSRGRSASIVKATSFVALVPAHPSPLPSSGRSFHHPACHSRMWRILPSCSRNGPNRSAGSRSSCIGNRRRAVRSRSTSCMPDSRRRTGGRRQRARPASIGGVASRAFLLTRGGHGWSSARSTRRRAAAYHLSHHRPVANVTIRKTGPIVRVRRPGLAITRQGRARDRFADRRAYRQ